MNKNVTVYTTSTCPYCTMVKNFLNDKGVKFTEVNLQLEPEKMEYVLQNTGQMGVPQTEIDGKWIIGFDPQNIDAMLTA
ncbi:glutaredoxin family protein [Bacillus marinisedimentorum]|uniref:glutaredoxin family protein n=1 Tax=Bacillus marinisedimentorum TaxID=1821260 RepID=UPI0008723A07|nr:glutaredoxin family protein [Bacillus marinisedimentorum]